MTMVRTKQRARLWTAELETSLAPLFAGVDEDGALVTLSFHDLGSPEEKEEQLGRQGWDPARNRSRCRHVEKQLREYLRAERREFELVLRPGGTPFQRKVWHQLAKVGYGETVTYAQLARRARVPRSIRAVGACNARNPIVVVLPCHRVVGSDGSLTGYGGGLARKQRLLELEGVAVE